MFDKLINIFKKVEEDNNTYAQEFLEFYKKCIEEFPRTLKTELRKVGIKPCTGNNNYVMTFMLADLLWWKSTIDNEPVYFREPAVIKSEVIENVLDVFDKLEIPDEKCREYIKQITDEVVNSTQ